MKVVWAGLILFVVMTALAGGAFNIVDFGTRPPPEGIQFFRDDTIIAVNVAMVAMATLPSVLLMMLIAWLGKRRGPLVGLVSILIVAVAWGLGTWLDMALSPYEPKRAAQWGAVWWFLGGLAYIVPAYLATYILLRRTRIMAPLFGPPAVTKSTALP
ncbi:MAG TPA: hypothetical protein VGD86_01945 [Devosia sp.]